MPLCRRNRIHVPTGPLGLVGFERRLVVEQPGLLTVVIELVNQFVREVLAPIVFVFGAPRRASCFRTDLGTGRRGRRL